MERQNQSIGARRRLACLLAALALLIGLAAPALAHAPAARVIRVGYPIQEGFTDVDENGNHSGYTYDYLEEIAQYLDWDYEFVEITGDLNDSLQTAYDMLMAGEVDLLGGTLYSDAMAELVDYATQSYGTGYTVLNVLQTNTNITQSNLPGTHGLRIAVMEQAKMRRQELEDYCQKNDIGYELMEFQTGEECIQAVVNGEADLLLDTDVSDTEGMRTVARFAPRPYYFVTTKGNTDIVREVNKAILAIDEADPYFSTTLHETYFARRDRSLLLSDAERAYVAAAGTVRVGVQLDKAPFMYRDPASGAFKGISLELLEYIGAQTGLTFEWVAAESGAELARLAAEEQIDLLAGMTYDYELAREWGVSMTRSYLSTQYVMLLAPGVSPEQTGSMRLALSKEVAYGRNLPEDVLICDNLAESIEAIRSGRADYTYGDGYGVQYYINQPRYQNISLIPQTDGLQQICIGLVRPSNENLLSILNKTLQSIPNETLQSIIYENTVYHQEVTLFSFVEANPGAALVLVLCLAAVIIAALMVVLHRRALRIRQTAMELRKHYELYNLSNEQFFEYDCRQDTLTLSNKKAEAGVVTVRPPKPGETEGLTPVEAWRGTFAQMIRHRPDGTEDIFFAMPDREARWTRITTRTICDDAGKPAYVLGKLTDIDEEKREKDALQAKAERDSLTGLYNAAVSRARISACLDRDARGALLVIDLDHFKDVNDNYGHYVGDQALTQMAAIFREVFRQEDVAGRVGGDEFVVFMDGVDDPATVQRRCAALLERVRAMDLSGGGLTVSIGAALARSGERYEDFYQRADAALYQAKENGRNGFFLDV